MRPTCEQAPLVGLSVTKHEVLLLENIHPAATDVFERNGFIVHTRTGLPR